jgi:RNA polymerase sigma-70 factor (sigma-E family)
VINVTASAGDGAEAGEEPMVTSLAAPVSFDAFYAEHHRAVVGLAVSLSGNRWAAEELAQDGFAAAFQHWDRIATYENPGAWVRRVVANRSVSRFRRLGSEAKALVRLAAQREATLPALTAEHDEFWREVRRLPRQQAQVVALHYLEDQSVADIADILGIAEGTVKSSLYRARQKLAERLGLHVDDEPDEKDER